MRKQAPTGVLKISLLFGLLALAGACTPTPAPADPTARPTPAVISVRLDGELDPLRPALAACAQAIGGSGLLVFEGLGPEPPSGELSVTITLGYAQDIAGETVRLGTEQIIVVVSTDSPLASLTEQELRQIFSGQTSVLPNSEIPSEVWAPLPGSAAHQALLDVMDGVDFSAESFLAPKPEAVLQALSENRGAIGVIPAAWASPGVRPVLTLAERPVLAVTNGEPNGKLRELLGCVQENETYQG